MKKILKLTNKKGNIALQVAILELEKPFPKNDLILSYTDFLKVRDYLAYYQFSPIVLENLINLANDLWHTQKRINRLSLLLKIKQYMHVWLQDTYKDGIFTNISPASQLSLETRKSLFNLFRKTFEESHRISAKQLKEARSICNNVLINLELTSTEEEWLCANFHLSDLILNRVLRYPIKSSVISRWVKDNFQNDALRNRRAELASWIIDREPTFEIKEQILIDDFEYLNKIDQQAIDNYDNEVYANKIIAKELDEYLPKKNLFDIFDNDIEKEVPDLSVPELKLFKRPYPVPTLSTNAYNVKIPNFEKLREEFYLNLPIHKKITMIWAIAYSRLDNAQKFSLLKKYYTNDTYYSMFKIGKRTRNLDLLKWLLAQQ